MACRKGTAMPNRRTMMRTSLAAFALTPIGAAGLRADDATVAETASGKIRGARSGDLHIFKGIPYGASTAGANRFMPPRKPEPWAGVRDAIVYAGRSPQASGGAQRPELATLWGVRDSLPVGEDCLTLNVWTPALDTREASRHGLAAWRRLLVRIGQLGLVRRRQPRAAQRRRRRLRQPPAQYLRPSRSLGHRRRALRPIRQRGRARSRGGAGMGARATPTASAAIPATSPSSASPAAAER